MSFIGCQFLGRLGNAMFSYAFARGFAERHGLELHTDRWVGQKIFEINDPPIVMHHAKCNRDENNIKDDDKDFVYRSYSQNQKCADYYTRERVKKWFAFRPEVESLLAAVKFDMPQNHLAHLRRGDYAGYGFPVISKQSYLKSAEQIGITDLIFVEEPKNPYVFPFTGKDGVLISLKSFDGDFSMLLDFYRMMKSDILFRGNSTFSWWAATLGNGRVFSPIVKGIGLVGGKEVDVEFVEGNHPACSDFDFVTDIHLKP